MNNQQMTIPGEYLISGESTVREAMKHMDQASKKTLFLIDSAGKLLSSLSDGDVRRCILAGGALDTVIETIVNNNPIWVEQDFDLENVKKLMITKKIEYIPVVNKEKKVVKILAWDEVFTNLPQPVKENIDVPVIIMAGGKGTRLDPFTKVLPKPLIPINGRPIIEIIMEKFANFGVKEFYISIGHQARMIKAYFAEGELPHKIKFIEETKPLGTAGALAFLKGQIKNDLLVTNCDIIIDGDYSEMLDFHRKNNNQITVIGSYRQYIIPYGVCEIENGGKVKDIIEKPEYDFWVNTGFCIVNGAVLRRIPDDHFYLMTDLIKDCLRNNDKVGLFPISEKSWIDIGQWKEYKKGVEQLS